MRKLIKPSALLLIVTGVAVGALLLVFGYAADAPGMCLIGLSLAFLLIMRGVYNAGIIKKGFLAPILLFCFGAGAVALSIALLVNGEFEDSPWLALVGVALGALLIVLGGIQLRKTRTSADKRVNK